MPFNIPVRNENDRYMLATVFPGTAPVIGQDFDVSGYLPNPAYAGYDVMHNFVERLANAVLAGPYPYPETHIEIYWRMVGYRYLLRSALSARRRLVQKFNVVVPLALPS